ncbi:hypothetical protein DPMN_158152 [Dreissena polymorpha]|uniref:Uncharacterized protein n=1 Tax=Dreissena polymorpha TaxID=45954 RepID=A0A9D4EGT6_DREPO|nr:hypothetical protein DPMN_158152 [Dreissena polymorpha]
MRELERFVLKARSVDPEVRHVRDCIDPQKFYLCVSAVQMLCGFDEQTMEYVTPSLANKIGQSLHKLMLCPVGTKTSKKKQNILS